MMYHFNRSHLFTFKVKFSVFTRWYGRWLLNKSKKKKSQLKMFSKLKETDIAENIIFMIT